MQRAFLLVYRIWAPILVRTNDDDPSSFSGGPDDGWAPPSIAMFGDEPKHARQTMPKSDQFLCNAHPRDGFQ